MPRAFSMNSSFGNIPVAQAVARFHLASCSPPVYAQPPSLRLFDTTLSSHSAFPTSPALSRHSWVPTLTSDDLTAHRTRIPAAGIIIHLAIYETYVA